MVTEKRDYITFMQVVSSIAVVTLHTNGCFYRFSTERYWITANIIESICCFSVPLFFMLSGITLVNFYEKYTLKEYFYKRFIKTFIPFIFWNLLGLFYKMSWGMIKPEIITLHFLWDGFTGNTFVAIFWFFIALLGIYLCIPLFAAVDKNKRLSVFTYLSIAGFFFNFLIPFLKRVFNLNFNWPFSISTATGYLFFIPTGLMLDHLTSESDSKKGNKRFLYSMYVLGLIGLLMFIEGTRILSFESGQIVSTFRGFINVPGILWSCGVFVFLKNFSKFIMNTPLSNAIRYVGKFSFEIYLMQYFIYDLFNRLVTINTKSIIYRLGMPWIVVLVTIGITSVLRKIPFVKHAVP